MSEELSEVVEAPGEISEPQEVAEAPAEEAAKEAPAEQPVSGKIAALLKREEQFQAKVRAQKEQLARERAEFERQKAEIESLKNQFARVKEDPIEGLKATGLSYEELTRRILADGTPEAKIDALQKKLETIEQARQREIEEREQQLQQQHIEASKESIKSHIFGNADKYPTLTQYDEARVREAAWNVAVQYYAQTKQTPDLDDLAQYLEDQAAKELETYESIIAKVRAKRGVVPPSPAPKGSPVKGGKTLSGTKTAERAMASLPPDYGKLSPEEQRAIDAEFLAKNLWKS